MDCSLDVGLQLAIIFIVDSSVDYFRTQLEQLVHKKTKQWFKSTHNFVVNARKFTCYSVSQYTKWMRKH